jgi:hypothetical protein
MNVMEYIDRGQGSSDRAIEAAQSNKLTKTKAVAALRKLLKLVNPSKEQLESFIRSLPREWHHTGLYGKRTEFYDISEVTAEVFAAWANPTETQIFHAKNETRVRVRRFLEKHGTKFVVTLSPVGKSALCYNTAMEDMGLFTGYDADSNMRRMLANREIAEADMAARQAKTSAYTFRLTTVREDIATAPLYFSVGALFECFGVAGEVA